MYISLNIDVLLWLQLEPTLHKTTKIVYNRTGSYAEQFDLEWLGR